VIFSTVLILVVASTIYEIVCNVNNFEKRKLLTSFSIYSNSKAIMTMKPSSSKEMLFLHGIRSLSIIWIVICHTYMITYWLVPTMNSHAMLDWLGNFSSMFFMTGFMGVDTFFMMSALLMTLSVFRELDKT
jgi:peptidoglycan/LPS O-acetylase OafA/YrhL